MLDRSKVSEDEGTAVHRRLCEYAQRRGALEAAEAYDLVRAEQLKVWLFHGCVSHWEYLERMLGYVPHTARERMRVAKRLVSLPLTMRKLADGTLTYSAVRELTRVATADTEEEWLTSTDGMSTHQIEREVAGHALGDRPQDPRPPDLRLRNLRLQLPTELYAMWRQARVALEAELGGELGDVQFVEQLLRRALDPGTGAAGPAHQIAYKQCDDCKRATQRGRRRRSRDREGALRRAAHRLARCAGAGACNLVGDTAYPRAGLCARRALLPIPGCRSRRNLEVHHIHEQARGGTHELSNLMLICSGHHTALHLGLLEISGDAPYQVKVMENVSPSPDRQESARGAERSAAGVPRGT